MDISKIMQKTTKIVLWRFMAEKVMPTFVVVSFFLKANYCFIYQWRTKF